MKLVDGMTCGNVIRKSRKKEKLMIKSNRKEKVDEWSLNRVTIAQVRLLY